jgi:hypothetical protein
VGRPSCGRQATLRRRRGPTGEAAAYQGLVRSKDAMRLGGCPWHARSTASPACCGEGRARLVSFGMQLGSASQSPLFNRLSLGSHVFRVYGQTGGEPAKEGARAVPRRPTVGPPAQQKAYLAYASTTEAGGVWNALKRIAVVDSHWATPAKTKHKRDDAEKGGQGAKRGQGRAKGWTSGDARLKVGGAVG